MRNKLTKVFALALSLCTISTTLLAHHGNATYDYDKKVKVSGTLTEWLWANPHCFLKFDAKDDKGEVAHWVVETSNPQEMATNGWGRDSLKLGDEITLTVIQAKNGRPVGRLIGKDILLNGKPFPPRASGASGTTLNRADP
jgi:hypothetical protein